MSVEFNLSCGDGEGRGGEGREGEGRGGRGRGRGGEGRGGEGRGGEGRGGGRELHVCVYVSVEFNLSCGDGSQWEWYTRLLSRRAESKAVQSNEA